MTRRPIWLFVLFFAFVLILNVQCSMEEDDGEPSVYVPQEGVPLTLRGNVVDAETKTPITNAEILIASIDGTKLVGDLTTDANGNFITSTENINQQTKVWVQAVAEGYSYQSVIAKIDYKMNLVMISNIELKPLEIFTETFTPGEDMKMQVEGKNAVSEAEKWIEVDIPGRALDTTEEISITPLTIDQLPGKTDAEVGVPLAAVALGPSNTVFNEPVTVTVPLPVTAEIGDQFPWEIYDANTNQWIQIGTAEAVTPTKAVVQMSQFGSSGVREHIIQDVYRVNGQLYSVTLYNTIRTVTRTEDIYVSDADWDTVFTYVEEYTWEVPLIFDLAVGWDIDSSWAGVLIAEWLTVNNPPLLYTHPVDSSFVNYHYHQLNAPSEDPGDGFTWIRDIEMDETETDQLIKIYKLGYDTQYRIYRARTYMYDPHYNASNPYDPWVRQHESGFIIVPGS